MDKPIEHDKSILEQCIEARGLYNAYNREKTGFAGSAGQEMGLSGALAPFLRSVLDVAQALWVNTQCEAERNLLRQFASELTRMYGEEK
jgi:hypothetical protein